MSEEDLGTRIMDLAKILQELKAAQDDFRQSDKAFATATFCQRTCKVLDEIVKGTKNEEFEHLVIGIWIVISSVNDLLPQLIEGPLLTELAEKLFRQCARVVLDIKWQQLDPSEESRENLENALSVCHQYMAPRGFTRFGVVNGLMAEPWTDPILTMVMGSEEDNEREEGLAYIKAQDPEILKLRVDLMYQENCDEFALNLCFWCLKHPVLAGDFTLHKIQFILLHRLGFIDRLQEECQSMGLVDSIRLINSLHCKEEHKELSTMLAQTFLIQNWIKPTDDNSKVELLRLWIRLQQQADEEDQDNFVSNLWAVAKVSQSTEQLLFIIDAVREKCGDTFLQFYLDLCIFAINVDKGCWEKLKGSSKTGPNEELMARKRDMAQVCNKLAHIVSHESAKVAFCCALTSFAMLPSEQSLQTVRDAYQRKHHAEASGKAQCCSNCASDIGECLKNEDTEKKKQDINVATLYEVERLCSMLRPSYLSCDSDLPSLMSMCKQYLKKEKGEPIRSALLQQKSLLSHQGTSSVKSVTAASQEDTHTQSVSAPQKAAIVRKTVDASSNVSNIDIPSTTAYMSSPPKSPRGRITSPASTHFIQRLVLNQLPSDTVQILLNLIQSKQVSPVQLNYLMTKNPDNCVQILEKYVSQFKQPDVKPDPDELKQELYTQQLPQVHQKSLEQQIQMQMLSVQQHPKFQCGMPSAPQYARMMAGELKTKDRLTSTIQALQQTLTQRPLISQTQVAGSKLPNQETVVQQHQVNPHSQQQARLPLHTQFSPMLQKGQQIRPDAAPGLCLHDSSGLKATSPVQIMTPKQPCLMQISSSKAQIVATSKASSVPLSGVSAIPLQKAPQTLRLPYTSGSMSGIRPAGKPQVLPKITHKTPGQTVSFERAAAAASCQLSSLSSENAGNRHYSINNLLFTGEQQNNTLSITLPDTLPEISLDSISDTLQALSDSPCGGNHVTLAGPATQSTLSTSCPSSVCVSSNMPSAVVSIPSIRGHVPVTQVQASVSPETASFQRNPVSISSRPFSTHPTQVSTSCKASLPSFSSLFVSSPSALHVSVPVSSAPVSSTAFVSQSTALKTSPGLASAQKLFPEVKAEGVGVKKSKEWQASDKEKMMQLLKQAMTIKVEKKEGHHGSGMIAANTRTPHQLSVPPVSVPLGGCKYTRGPAVNLPASMTRPVVQQSSQLVPTTVSIPKSQQSALPGAQTPVTSALSMRGSSSVPSAQCMVTCAPSGTLVSPSSFVSSQHTSVAIQASTYIPLRMQGPNQNRDLSSKTACGNTLMPTVQNYPMTSIPKTSSSVRFPIQSSGCSSIDHTPGKFLPAHTFSTALVKPKSSSSSTPQGVGRFKTYPRTEAGEAHSLGGTEIRTVTSEAIPANILPEGGGVIERATSGNQSVATYRCIICAKAFMTLNALRYHVKQICKPGLSAGNPVTVSNVKASEAGVETSTVFQCMRCYELCISHTGIREHKQVCSKGFKEKAKPKSKAKPKVIDLEQEEATQAKVQELLNRCLGENREKLQKEAEAQAAKLANAKKKFSRKRPSVDEDHVSVGPMMPAESPVAKKPNLEERYILSSTRVTGPEQQDGSSGVNTEARVCNFRDIKSTTPGLPETVTVPTSSQVTYSPPSVTAVSTAARGSLQTSVTAVSTASGGSLQSSVTAVSTASGGSLQTSPSVTAVSTAGRGSLQTSPSVTAVSTAGRGSLQTSLSVTAVSTAARGSLQTLSACKATAADPVPSASETAMTPVTADAPAVCMETQVSDSKVQPEQASDVEQSSADASLQTVRNSGAVGQPCSPAEPLKTETTESTDSISLKQEQKETVPPPQYKELRGSCGRSFFKCSNCGQTLCSMQSLSEHWQECINKKPLPVKEEHELKEVKVKENGNESRTMDDLVTTGFADAVSSHCGKQLVKVEAAAAAEGIVKVSSEPAGLKSDDCYKSKMSSKAAGKNGSAASLVKQSVVLLEKISLPEKSPSDAFRIVEQADSEVMCTEVGGQSVQNSGNESLSNSSSAVTLKRSTSKDNGLPSKSCRIVHGSPVRKDVIVEVVSKESRQGSRPASMENKPQMEDSQYCTVCTLSFSQSAEFIQHLASAHLKTYKQETAGNSVFICHFCQQRFSDLSQCISHAVVHSEAIVQMFNEKNSQKSMPLKCRSVTDAGESAGHQKKHHSQASPMDHPEEGDRNEFDQKRSPETLNSAVSMTKPTSSLANDRRSSGRAAQKQALNKIYISSLGINSFVEPLKESNKRKTSTDEMSIATNRPKRARLSESMVELMDFEDEENSEESSDETDEDDAFARKSGDTTDPLATSFHSKAGEKASMGSSKVQTVSKHRLERSSHPAHCSQVSASPLTSPKAQLHFQMPPQKPSFMDSFLHFVNNRSPDEPLPLSKPRRRYSFLNDSLENSSPTANWRRSSCEEHMIQSTSPHQTAVLKLSPVMKAAHKSDSVTSANKMPKSTPSEVCVSKQENSDFENVYFYGEYEKQLTQQVKVNLGPRVKPETVQQKQAVKQQNTSCMPFINVKKCSVNLGPKINAAALIRSVKCNEERTVVKHSDGICSEEKVVKEPDVCEVSSNEEESDSDTVTVSDSDTVVASCSALSPVRDGEDTISLDGVPLVTNPDLSSSSPVPTADKTCIEATQSVVPLPTMSSPKQNTEAVVNSVILRDVEETTAISQTQSECGKPPVESLQMTESSDALASQESKPESAATGTQETADSVKYAAENVGGQKDNGTISSATVGDSTTHCCAEGDITIHSAAVDDITTDNATVDDSTTDSATVDYVTEDRGTVNDVMADKTVLDDVTSESATMGKITEDSAKVDDITAGRTAVDIGDKITGDFLTDSAIANNTTTDTVAADGITVDGIEADDITSDKTMADDITKDSAEADDITADKTMADDITTDTVVANDITADSTEADDITSDKVGNDDITKDSAEADDITADKTMADDISKDCCMAEDMTVNSCVLNERKTDNAGAKSLMANSLTGDDVLTNKTSITTNGAILDDKTRDRIIVDDIGGDCAANHTTANRTMDKTGIYEGETVRAKREDVPGDKCTSNDKTVKDAVTDDSVEDRAVTDSTSADSEVIDNITTDSAVTDGVENMWKERDITAARTLHVDCQAGNVSTAVNGTAYTPPADNATAHKITEESVGDSAGDTGTADISSGVAVSQTFLGSRTVCSKTTDGATAMNRNNSVADNENAVDDDVVGDSTLGDDVITGDLTTEGFVTVEKAASEKADSNVPDSQAGEEESLMEETPVDNDDSRAETRNEMQHPNRCYDMNEEVQMRAGENCFALQVEQQHPSQCEGRNVEETNRDGKKTGTCHENPLQEVAEQCDMKEISCDKEQVSPSRAFPVQRVMQKIGLRDNLCTGDGEVSPTSLQAAAVQCTEMDSDCQEKGAGSRSEAKQCITECGSLHSQLQHEDKETNDRQNQEQSSSEHSSRPLEPRADIGGPVKNPSAQDTLPQAADGFPGHKESEENSLDNQELTDINPKLQTEQVELAIKPEQHTAITPPAVQDIHAIQEEWKNHSRSPEAGLDTREDKNVVEELVSKSDSEGVGVPGLDSSNCESESAHDEVGNGCAEPESAVGVERDCKHSLAKDHVIEKNQIDTKTDDFQMVKSLSSMEYQDSRHWIGDEERSFGLSENVSSMSGGENTEKTLCVQSEEKVVELADKKVECEKSVFSEIEQDSLSLKLDVKIDASSENVDSALPVCSDQERASHSSSWNEESQEWTEKQSIASAEKTPDTEDTLTVQEGEPNQEQSTTRDAVKGSAHQDSPGDQLSCDSLKEGAAKHRGVSQISKSEIQPQEKPDVSEADASQKQLTVFANKSSVTSDDDNNNAGRKMEVDDDSDCDGWDTSDDTVNFVDLPAEAHMGEARETHPTSERKTVSSSVIDARSACHSVDPCSKGNKVLEANSCSFGKPKSPLLLAVVPSLLPQSTDNSTLKESEGKCEDCSLDANHKCSCHSSNCLDGEGQQKMKTHYRPANNVENVGGESQKSPSFHLPDDPTTNIFCKQSVCNHKDPANCSPHQLKRAESDCEVGEQCGLSADGKDQFSQRHEAQGENEELRGPCRLNNFRSAVLIKGDGDTTTDSVTWDILKAESKPVTGCASVSDEMESTASTSAAIQVQDCPSVNTTLEQAQNSTAVESMGKANNGVLVEKYPSAQAEIKTVLSDSTQSEVKACVTTSLLSTSSHDLSDNIRASTFATLSEDQRTAEKDDTSVVGNVCSSMDTAVGEKVTEDMDSESDLPELCIVPDPQGTVIRPKLSDKKTDRKADSCASRNVKEQSASSPSVSESYERQYTSQKARKESKFQTTYLEVKPEKKDSAAPIKSPTSPKKSLLGMKSLRQMHKPEPFVWDEEGDEDCRKTRRNERSLKAFRSKVHGTPFSWDHEPSDQRKKAATEQMTTEMDISKDPSQSNYRPSFQTFPQKYGSASFSWKSKGANVKTTEKDFDTKDGSQRTASGNVGIAARDEKYSSLTDGEELYRGRYGSPKIQNKTEDADDVYRSEKCIKVKTLTTSAQGRLLPRSKGTLRSGSCEKNIVAAGRPWSSGNRRSVFGKDRPLRKSRSCDIEYNGTYSEHTFEPVSSQTEKQQHMRPTAEKKNFRVRDRGVMSVSKGLKSATRHSHYTETQATTTRKMSLRQHVPLSDIKTEDEKTFWGSDTRGDQIHTGKKPSVERNTVEEKSERRSEFSLTVVDESEGRWQPSINTVQHTTMVGSKEESQNKKEFHSDPRISSTSSMSVRQASPLYDSVVRPSSSCSNPARQCHSRDRTPVREKSASDDVPAEAARSDLKDCVRSLRNRLFKKSGVTGGVERSALQEGSDCDSKKPTDSVAREPAHASTGTASAMNLSTHSTEGSGCQSESRKPVTPKSSPILSGKRTLEADVPFSESSARTKKLDSSTSESMSPYPSVSSQQYLPAKVRRRHQTPNWQAAAYQPLRKPRFSPAETPQYEIIRVEPVTSETSCSQQSSEVERSPRTVHTRVSVDNISPMHRPDTAKAGDPKWQMNRQITPSERKRKRKDHHFPFTFKRARGRPRT